MNTNETIAFLDRLAADPLNPEVTRQFGVEVVPESVSRKRCGLCDTFPGGQCPACAVPADTADASEPGSITGVDDHPDTQGVFSWDAAENHLFQVVREPRQRTKPGDPHPGYEWVCRSTIARFYGATASTLLERCVQALRNEGWAWVEP